MKTKTRIANVPTNIVTGFLGTGKTSAILHLLKSKPADERWAVLVNEFGEIGVDGSLFKGQHREEDGVFVHEVPGGCMCCAAGVPMQIAMNRLLARARPHRLLIEPTGLGHPIEVLGVLSGQYYEETLSIHTIVTLVDARHLSDSRYTDHETFNQQIAIADILLANKADLYQDADRVALKAFAAQWAPHAALLTTERGVLDPSCLQGRSRFAGASPHHHAHAGDQRPPASDLPFPESGSLRVENEGEGFKSLGWRFAPDKPFERDELLAFLRAIDAERMKAVFITTSGCFSYNRTKDSLTETRLESCPESRIEIIAREIDPSWEQRLFACLTTNS